MSVYTDLLFMHGHIANVELARQLAGQDGTDAAEEARDIGKTRRDERGHEHTDEPPLRHQPRRNLVWFDR
jgi:hypothetical protein